MKAYLEGNKRKQINREDILHFLKYYTGDVINYLSIPRINGFTQASFYSICEWMESKGIAVCCKNNPVSYSIPNPLKVVEAWNNELDEYKIPITAYNGLSLVYTTSTSEIGE